MTNDAAYHEEQAASYAKAAGDYSTISSSTCAASIALAHAEIAKSMRLGEIAAAIRGEGGPVT